MTQPMTKLRILTATAVITAVIWASMGAPPLSAQEGGNGPGRTPFLQRYPAYTAWSFDGRDDVRDFPTNGFFPGDFAANPPAAGIGAAGLFGWTARSPRLADGSPPDCAQRRPYNAASGSVRRYDGAWHRCRR